MRRPLFWVALCLVVVAALRLWTGACGTRLTGCVSTGELPGYETLAVTGQVYQKDDESIYLRSVKLTAFHSLDFSESGAAALSAVESQQEIPIQEKIICETAQAEKLPLGSIVTVSGTFVPFSHASNPGEFDAAEYYRTLQIGGRLIDTRLIRADGSRWRVREGLYALKMYFKKRLYRSFPEKEAAVMSALLLGDKSELDTELKSLYKRNGILHILSISSLHITIIGMSIYRLFRRAGVPIWAAACAGSVLLILYGGMTGFGVSACRAIGMYLLRMTAELLGRTYDMLTALGVLAAAMVAVNPYYLQHSGFLLSFTSVLGIGVTYQNLRLPGRRAFGNKSRWRRLTDSLAGAALASLSITLTTLPIQLWFYYEVPVCSVLINLCVLPFMKPLMIIGLLVMLVPGMGVLGGVDCAILRGYELLCRGFDCLPFSVWNPGRPEIWQIVLYYVILLGVVLFCRHQRLESRYRTGEDDRVRRRVTAVLAAAALAVAVLLIGFKPAAGNRAVFLDVGQGDCILVQTASGENYLFDCGSSRSGVGRYVLLPFLKYSGVHKLDAVVLSHPDSDHINGALELLACAEENSVEIGQLVLPAIEETAREAQLQSIIQAAEQSGRRGVPVRYLAAGEGWKCGSADFLCLHPAAGWPAEEENAYSLCIYVQFMEGASLLLTGDVEAAGEKALLRELEERRIENLTILKTPHHGSRGATSRELLEQLQPQLAVISCGRNNRYGHPHRELLQRLEDCGCAIYQTKDSGAVSVLIKEKRVEVREYR